LPLVGYVFGIVAGIFVAALQRQWLIAEYAARGEQLMGFCGTTYAVMGGAGGSVLGLLIGAILVGQSIRRSHCR
jgi:hypothetical protein